MNFVAEPKERYLCRCLCAVGAIEIRGSLSICHSNQMDDDAMMVTRKWLSRAHTHTQWDVANPTQAKCAIILKWIDDGTRTRWLVPVPEKGQPLLPFYCSQVNRDRRNTSTSSREHNGWAHSIDNRDSHKGGMVVYVTQVHIRKVAATQWKC